MQKSTGIEPLDNIDKAILQSLEKIARLYPDELRKVITLIQLKYASLGWTSNLERLEKLYRVCMSKELRFIPIDTSYENFKLVFIGDIPPSERVQFLGNGHQLVYFIECLRFREAIKEKTSNFPNEQLCSMFLDHTGKEYNAGSLGTYKNKIIGKKSGDKVDALMIEVFDK